MAAHETEWSLPLSDELPKGLFDGFPEREVRKVSPEAMPSTSGSHHVSRVNRSRKAMSYFSKIDQEDINRMKTRYQILDDVVLRIPDLDERACYPKYEGDVAFYEVDFQAGIHFPLQPFVRELLDYLSLAPGQVTLNGWRTIISCMVMWRVSSNGREDLTVDEFLFCYEPCQIAASPGFWMFKHLDMETRIVHGLPSSNMSWKDVLDRPLLNSVWKERISRILDIKDRSYSIFIEPDLLASFSFGANTMKLNKGKLRKFTQLGEVVVALASLKHKKVDEGPSKQVEQSSSHPPVCDVALLVKTVPPVIMVDIDPSLLADPLEVRDATINQSPHVAMSRAKSAVSTRDMEDYSTAHTEDVHYLLIHSLMRSLNEVMVMNQRCIVGEEDLAALRTKSVADEAEMKNMKRAVAKLTRDRKEVLIELEKVKTKLKVRDDDVKVAVEAKDKVVVDLQYLVGQIEGAKVVAVSEFRVAEAFDDINTRYFLSGFEAFRKQAAERFPDLDFSVF
uniref:Uncharacterized protein n=1 Tax=Fagus sylvatica TaxID=28930 RepID=A0A2N9GNN4_FAGSY